jgi:hypothetical protein
MPSIELCSHVHNSEYGMTWHQTDSTHSKNRCLTVVLVHYNTCHVTPIHTHMLLVSLKP